MATHRLRISGPGRTLVNRLVIFALLAPLLASADKPPEIELLTPGSGPQSALSLRASEETEQDVSLVIRSAVKETAAGKSSQTPMPDVSLDGVLSAVQRTDQGYSYTLTFRSIRVLKTANVDKGTTRNLRRHWKKLNGMAFKAFVTPHGQLTLAKLTLPMRPHPAISSPLKTLQNILRSLHVALPKQPVGSGATWRLKEPTSQDGVGMVRTHEWTLKKTGDVHVLQDHIQDTTDPASVTLGALPKDMKARVTSVGGTGSIRAKWATQQVLPTTWSLVLDHHLTVQASIGGAEFETRTEVRTRATLKTTLR